MGGRRVWTWSVYTIGSGAAQEHHSKIHSPAGCTTSNPAWTRKEGALALHRNAEQPKRAARGLLAAWMCELQMGGGGC